ncbi:hypothetical protein BG006_010416 [Podila minutissima]|uniref:F-box domain-containing protein n=1 Tax=Podila minutissima TaxID=64525 RepID=A0A9P5VI90_9FUNG|nr:hypothetical protein BG006_010416 [Podila minutissima]
MSSPDTNASADTTSLTAQSSESLPIEQISVFSKLPSELTLEIFSYVDIVSLFRFLDTCRYHRFLLLNLPELWHRIRFIPVSEYTTLATASSNSPHTSILAAANSPPVTENHASASSSSDVSKTTTKASRRLKHAENERDRDRGGSESLTSEIYAVLRRFRKSNRLVDFVREVYMDGTDSMHFPSPLVMLIKFPQLQVLSSRYRRNQISIARETVLLKDMLRNGSIAEHGLQLRRWDIFHPYMTKDEGVLAFKHILDLISAVSNGVALDIKRCPGPKDGPEIKVSGGGSHWATAAAQYSTGIQPQAATPPLALANNDTNIETTATPPPLTKICTNIVWTLEKCRVCDTPQDRCWQCVPICKRCRAIRAPPHINHQTALERERQRTAKPSSSVTSPTAQNQKSSEILSPRPQHLKTSTAGPRSLTPPGSISLSQMSNPALAISSAYAYLPPTPDPSPVLAWQPSSGVQAPQQPSLALPPEFSYFD